MNQANITQNLSPARSAALLKEERRAAPPVPWCCRTGRVVTGKTGNLLGAATALLMNALKGVSGSTTMLYVISDDVLEPICHLKTEHLKSHNPRLHSDETLLALSISSVHNPLAAELIDNADKRAVATPTSRSSSPRPTRSCTRHSASTCAASRSTSSHRFYHK